MPYFDDDTLDTDSYYEPFDEIVFDDDDDAEGHIDPDLARDLALEREAFDIVLDNEAYERGQSALIPVAVLKSGWDAIQAWKGQQ